MIFTPQNIFNLVHLAVDAADSIVGILHYAGRFLGMSGSDSSSGSTITPILNETRITYFWISFNKSTPWNMCFDFCRGCIPFVLICSGIALTTSFQANLRVVNINSPNFRNGKFPRLLKWYAENNHIRFQWQHYLIVIGAFAVFPLIPIINYYITFVCCFDQKTGKFFTKDMSVYVDDESEQVTTSELEIDWTGAGIKKTLETDHHCLGDKQSKRLFSSVFGDGDKASSKTTAIADVDQRSLHDFQFTPLAGSCFRAVVSIVLEIGVWYCETPAKRAAVEPVNEPLRNLSMFLSASNVAMMFCSCMRSSTISAKVCKGSMLSFDFFVTLYCALAYVTSTKSSISSSSLEEGSSTSSLILNSTTTTWSPVAMYLGGKAVMFAIDALHIITILIKELQRTGRVNWTDAIPATVICAFFGFPMLIIRWNTKLCTIILLFADTLSHFRGNSKPQYLVFHRVLDEYLNNSQAWRNSVNINNKLASPSQHQIIINWEQTFKNVRLFLLELCTQTLAESSSVVLRKKGPSFYRGSYPHVSVRNFKQKIEDLQILDILTCCVSYDDDADEKLDRNKNDNDDSFASRGYHLLMVSRLETYIDICKTLGAGGIKKTSNNNKVYKMFAFLKPNGVDENDKDSNLIYLHYLLSSDDLKKIKKEWSAFLQKNPNAFSNFNFPFKPDGAFLDEMIETLELAKQWKIPSTKENINSNSSDQKKKEFNSPHDVLLPPSSRIKIALRGINRCLPGGVMENGEHGVVHWFTVPLIFLSTSISTVTELYFFIHHLLGAGSSSSATASSFTHCIFESTGSICNDLLNTGIACFALSSLCFMIVTLPGFCRNFVATSFDAEYLQSSAQRLFILFPNSPREEGLNRVFYVLAQAAESYREKPKLVRLKEDIGLPNEENGKEVVVVPEAAFENHVVKFLSNHHVVCST